MNGIIQTIINAVIIRAPPTKAVVAKVQADLDAELLQSRQSMVVSNWQFAKAVTAQGLRGQVNSILAQDADAGPQGARRQA